MDAAVYLFTGAEFGERNDAIKNIKASMAKKFGSIDEYTYYFSDTSMDTVLTTLRSGSLFEAASCVILRGSELIKTKEDISLLASWISSTNPSAKNKSPSVSAVLILVSDDVSVDSRIEKLVPKSNRRIFWEMFDNRKAEWLQSFFKKAGYILLPDAAESILDLVENNTEALREECSQFLLGFDKGSEITVADVEKILAHNRAESAFTLFNSMSETGKQSQERFEVSLGVLKKLMLSKSFSSVMVIAGLTSCFRRLLIWHTLHENGNEPDPLTLKIKGFSSQRAKTQYKSAARIWNARQTTGVLALLSSTDIEIRSLGMQMEECQLQMMLYAIVMKNGIPCSAYV